MGEKCATETETVTGVYCQRQIPIFAGQLADDQNVCQASMARADNKGAEIQMRGTYDSADYDANGLGRGNLCSAYLLN